MTSSDVDAAGIKISPRPYRLAKYAEVAAPGPDRLPHEGVKLTDRLDIFEDEAVEVDNSTQKATTKRKPTNFILYIFLVGKNEISISMYLKKNQKYIMGRIVYKWIVGLSELWKISF